MKKLYLLLFVPCLINPSLSIVSASENSIILSDKVAYNFTNSFKQKIELKSKLNFLYDAYLPPLTIIDQFDNNNRVNLIKYNNNILQEIYLAKDDLGYVVEQYLSVSNVVENRYITNSNSEYIKFDDYYGTPFNCFTNLSSAQLNSYFDIKENNDTYILKANNKGYGTFTNSLLKFYSDYDYMVWDNSVSESIVDFEMTIDKEGIPLSFTFNKIKKDIFGGIKENYVVDITLLDEVETLKPCVSSMSEDLKTKFNTNMLNFQNLLNKGNFIETITFSSDAFNEDIVYSNYYALNPNPSSNFIEAMICSYPLEETTQGETYVCVLNEGTSEVPSFSAYGLSPATQYFSSISSDSYTSFEEIVPKLSDISCEFFTYNAFTHTYTFNFSSFIHGDSYFYGDLLTSLYGMLDPFVQFVGFYLDDYSYNFNNLTIGFDEDGYPYGTLSYNYSSFVINSSFTFSSIGTTNLETASELETAVNFIRNYIL